MKAALHILQGGFFRALRGFGKQFLQIRIGFVLFGKAKREYPARVLMKKSLDYSIYHDIYYEYRKMKGGSDNGFYSKNRLAILW